MSTVRTNTLQQSPAPFLYRFDYDGVVEFVPLFSHSSLQIFDVSYSATIDPLLQYAPSTVIHGVQVGGKKSGVSLSSNAIVMSAWYAGAVLLLGEERVKNSTLRLDRVVF